MNPGIYVHIPYCSSKCHYCDFNSYALGQARTEPYVRALLREIERTAAEVKTESRFETVFFGGGTPTMCSGEQLVRILNALRSSYDLSPEAEITTEANPGTVTLEQLAQLRQGGFNRISFGVQSFDNALLRSIGRIHTDRQAEEAVALAREAGFANINVDLMFGLPGQALPAFGETLDRAFELDVPHLSIYGLIVEEGTAFGRWHEQGKLDLPDDSLEREMYDLVLEQTAEYGYEQYEISNFAKPGFRCAHNQVYWRNEPYLGFGAGAVAYWNGVRRTNCLLPGEYVRRMREVVSLSIEEERLDPRDALGESLMLGLRMMDGVDIDALSQRFGLDVRFLYAAHLRRMTELHLLESDGSRMRLTREGLPLANEVWAGFIGGG
ncbi:MAG: radical SAM family heme chaperone HemW [Armatimonadetes bacterium]|nr:radical SAM family heme chaperone HemW [Armatimonadota bacterium]